MKFPASKVTLIWLASVFLTPFIFICIVSIFNGMDSPSSKSIVEILGAIIIFGIFSLVGSLPSVVALIGFTEWLNLKQYALDDFRIRWIGCFLISILINHLIFVAVLYWLNDPSALFSFMLVYIPYFFIGLALFIPMSKKVWMKIEEEKKPKKLF